MHNAENKTEIIRRFRKRPVSSISHYIKSLLLLVFLSRLAFLAVLFDFLPLHPLLVECAPGIVAHANLKGMYILRN